MLARFNACDLYGQTECPTVWFASRAAFDDWMPEPTFGLSLVAEDGTIIDGLNVVGRLLATEGLEWMMMGRLDTSTSVQMPFDTGDLAQWTSQHPFRFRLCGRADNLVSGTGS